MNGTKLKKLFKKYSQLQNLFPYQLIVFGSTGLIASAMINIEKVNKLKNPDSTAICDINPIYSCNSVVNSWQAEVFGFSNEILGIISFSIIITVGILLANNTKFQEWFWKLFIVGMMGSMAFVVWFFYQSVYNIGALCIYCSIVWVSTWSVTLPLLLYTYRQKLISYPKSVHKILDVVSRYLPSMWFLVIFFSAVLIVQHFWYYYKTLL
jgi:uncharacterized membrane protein